MRYEDEAMLKTLWAGDAPEPSISSRASSRNLRSSRRRKILQIEAEVRNTVRSE